MEALHYYNGQYLKKNEICISPADVGFSRGYGVFEFFRVHNNQPVFLTDHLARLSRSADALNLALPQPLDELKTLIHTLIRKNDMPISSIKITVTGGVSDNGFSSGRPTLLIMQLPFQPLAQVNYERGASLMTFEYQRDLPEVKSLGYAQALALESTWKQKGHIDVLYHQEGLLSEVSRSSVFLIKEGKVMTNQNGVLAGVTQQRVISAIGDELPVAIRDLRLDELLTADEVFITSTSKKVLPIVGIDDHVIGNGKPGALTQQVMKAFDHYFRLQLD